jgi:L,D-transpeptidase YcbB
LRPDWLIFGKCSAFRTEARFPNGIETAAHTLFRANLDQCGAFVKKSVLLASVAAALALAGCGGQGVDGPGSEAAASVRPDRVDAQELRASANDERVQRFYEARGWQAAWTKDHARGLSEALAEAGRHALNGADFLSVEEDASPARREAALTLAAINYGEALANGVTEPDKIHEVYTLPRPRADVVAGLAQAIESGQVREWLASLAPNDPEYRALSEAYLQYRQRANQEQGRAIEGGGAIRQGDSDPRVPLIAEALRTNGYLPPAASQQEGQQQAQQQQAQQSTRYTAEMAEAVKRLQADYGLEADGIVGESTLAALNTGAIERARTLAVNLERRRWLDREVPATRIDVNTAAAVLDFWRDGSHADHRRVVVGQPGNETPALGSPMFRLVANPTWTVPKSIEEEEIAPRGEDYLRRNNMVRNADGWIVQQSGPQNALGLVKFDMKNDHAIYLHDTPAKSLFQRNQRHFSHGCVRVDDALGFARMLAEREGVLDEWERARATGKETFVSLPREIPVRLLYHTAFVGPNGQVMFRTDPYGWDDAVAQALGHEARERRQLRQHINDVGP